MRIPEATVEQMKDIDRLMPEEFGISLLQMMENAGRLLADAAINEFKPERAVILAGPGNNGADGLVAARYLHNAGVSVEVVLSSERGMLGDTAAGHLKTLDAIGVPSLNKPGGKPDVVLDCLLGYNTRGAPRGRVAELIRMAKSIRAPVLCCDIPSGFEPSTGEWHEPSFQDAVVMTLGLPKAGMTGDSRIRKLLVGDIGIPPEAYQKAGIDAPMMHAGPHYTGVGR